MAHPRFALYGTCLLLSSLSFSGCALCAPEESAGGEVQEEAEPAAALPEGSMPGTEGETGATAELTEHDWDAYLWGPGEDAVPLSSRVRPPPGFARLEGEEQSFGAWLRELPTKPGRPAVRLHDGGRKGNQSAHALVVDMDVGERDLQQCADAVMRLRAEWQFVTGRHDAICFRFTSGDEARWDAWRNGDRAVVDGNDVSWRRSARPDDSYSSFRKYLDLVYLYAGTWSLERELRPVDARIVLPGDVLIQGGSPGHAVMVLDVAEHPDGRRALLLGQSFMPAQDFHVLVNPGSDISPWYVAAAEGEVRTPEWTFDWRDLMRFQNYGCPVFQEPSRTR